MMASASLGTSGLILVHEDEMKSIHQIHLGKLNLYSFISIYEQKFHRNNFGYYCLQ